ncbi:MAG TPA: hypothetical protein VLG50_02875 [Candidatus Saccharimonadales bacterium]|nr:hypothetical protein [Candidatus Saccharimonadales bacterium]
MKNIKNYFFSKRFLALCFLIHIHTAHTAAPLGLFVPYDINIKLKKPAIHNWQAHILGEKSYKVRGFATDCAEEETFKVNVLQIYEPVQNVVAMYQGFDTNGIPIQTLNTPFTQLLDSIAGGPGGGVSNLENGLFQPSGTLSCGQVALGTTYSFANSFYVSAYLPICFARLCNVHWQYLGNNTLFSGEKIQQELVDSFTQDLEKYFDLRIGGWKQSGLGDLTVLLEWQQDFPQRRQILKNVQGNIRIGLSFPTSAKTNEHVIMPVPFGADGAVSLPFGGGLNLKLSSIAEVGFSGQFWYFWSNHKLRRIKTFPTQTTLLLPTLTPTFKQFAFLQNFNLFAQFFTPNQRYSLKAFYQYWRKQKDILTPVKIGFTPEVVNSALNIDEVTRHDIVLLAAYTPLRGDYQCVIPQFEIFWKSSFKGMRAAIASTYGAQFSLIF